MNKTVKDTEYIQSPVNIVIYDIIFHMTGNELSWSKTISPATRKGGNSKDKPGRDPPPSQGDSLVAALFQQTKPQVLHQPGTPTPAPGVPKKSARHTEATCGALAEAVCAETKSLSIFLNQEGSNRDPFLQVHSCLETIRV